jgi:hypothetical protein
MPTLPARLLCAVLALLLLGGCKINRTPREFIDRTAPAGERAGVLERMLEERFGEMDAALARGDAAAAAAALHPALGLRVAGAGGVRGGAALIAALGEVPAERAGVVISEWGALPEPNPNFLWFTAELPEGGAATGIYQREGAEWRLTLFHLTPPGG